MAINTVKIGEVCRTQGASRVRMTVAERLTRKGPFPLYADNCMSTGIDDYSIEAGGAVMVPGYGSVVGNNGYVMARLEEGRCSTTEAVNALVPNDPADLRYIYRMVTNSPAVARQVGGTAQLRQLPEQALLAAHIPWPCRSTRDAFVDMMDADEARANELAAAAPALLAEGDAAFARIVAGSGAPDVPLGEVVRWQQGTNVPAADRGMDKPVRVEGPRGRLGRCDEALAGEPAVMVGPAGRTMVSHFVGEPSHPIAEMSYARACDSEVPLPVLLFALRAAGVTDDPRSAARPAGMHRVAPEEMEALPVNVGTDAARAEFDALGADILERIVRAERERDELLAAHGERVAAFFADGTVWGNGSCDGCDSAAGDVPPPCGPRGAQDAAVEPVGDLGALKPLVDEGIALLGNPVDVAWELAPLAVLRACASESQWAFVRAAASQWAAPAYANLVRVLGTVMGELAESDDLLSFLPNLSYESSLLSAPQLAAWVNALDALEPAQVGGDQVRALFALDRAANPVPAGVMRVVARAMADAAPAAASGYVPFGAGEGVLDVFGVGFPQANVRVQMPEFSDVLAGMLVRAAQLKGQADTRGGVGAAAAEAIRSDEFADWRADLVAAVLPNNAGEWCTGTVDRDDPRWGVLGVPPRNKANFAWVQQALYHQAPGGATVLLAGNTVLHSSMGSEAKLREALASSGRVRAVVALPARIFADGRSPMSLLVLGDEGCADRALMVNALDVTEGASLSVRAFPDEAAERVCEALHAWLAEGACEPQAGFCRAVGLDEVAACEGMLTPWSYV